MPSRSGKKKHRQGSRAKYTITKGKTCIVDSFYGDCAIHNFREMKEQSRYVLRQKIDKNMPCAPYDNNVLLNTYIELLQSRDGYRYCIDANSQYDKNRLALPQADRTLSYILNQFSIDIDKLKYYSAKLNNDGYPTIIERLTTLYIIAKFCASVLTYKGVLYPDDIKADENSDYRRQRIRLNGVANTIYDKVDALVADLIAELSCVTLSDVPDEATELKSILKNQHEMLLRGMLSNIKTIFKFCFLLQDIAGCSLLEHQSKTPPVVNQGKIKVDDKALSQHFCIAHARFINALINIHKRLTPNFLGLDGVSLEHDQEERLRRHATQQKKKTSKKVKLYQIMCDANIKKLNEHKHYTFHPKLQEDETNENYHYAELARLQSAEVSIKGVVDQIRIPVAEVASERAYEVHLTLSAYNEKIKAADDNFLIGLLREYVARYCDLLLDKSEHQLDRESFEESLENDTGSKAAASLRNRIKVESQRKPRIKANSFVQKQAVGDNSESDTYSSDQKNNTFEKKLASVCIRMQNITCKGPFNGNLVSTFFTNIFEYVEEEKYARCDTAGKVIKPTLDYLNDTCQSTDNSMTTKFSLDDVTLRMKAIGDADEFINGYIINRSLTMHAHGFGTYTLIELCQIFFYIAQWSVIEQYCQSELSNKIPDFLSMAKWLDGIEQKLSHVMREVHVDNKPKLYITLYGYVAQRVQRMLMKMRDRQANLTLELTEVRKRIIERKNKRDKRGHNRLTEQQVKKMIKTKEYQRYAKIKQYDNNFLTEFYRLFSNDNQFMDIIDHLTKLYNNLSSPLSTYQLSHSSSTLCPIFRHEPDDVKINPKATVPDIGKISEQSNDDHNAKIFSRIKKFYESKPHKKYRSHNEMRALVAQLKPRDCALYKCLDSMKEEGLIKRINDVFTTTDKTAQCYVMGSAIWPLLSSGKYKLLKQHKYNQSTDIDLDIFFTSDASLQDKDLRNAITAVVDESGYNYKYRFSYEPGVLRYLSISEFTEPQQAGRFKASTSSLKYPVDINIAKTLTQPWCLADCLCFNVGENRFEVLENVDVHAVMHSIVNHQLIENPNYIQCKGHEHYIAKKEKQLKAMGFSRIEMIQMSLPYNQRNTMKGSM